MTNKLRDAAQMALEALVDAQNHNYSLKHKEADQLVKTLRAALAEQQSAKHGEPVAWLSRDDARLALWEAIHKREFGNPTDDKLILEHLRQHGLWIGKFSATAPKPKAEQQEPVAKTEWDIRGVLASRLKCWHRLTEEEAAELVAFYTTPQPKAEPLTEEELRQCAEAMDAEPLAEGWPELLKFARAIERAHGIGEKK